MAKAKSLNPKEHLHVKIAPELKQRIDLMLYSAVEERIPKGAHMEFVEARLREWFEWKNTPLEPFGFPQGYYVTGPEPMVEALIKRLKGETNGNT